jgi:hypothetical protein
MPDISRSPTLRRRRLSTELTQLREQTEYANAVDVDKALDWTAGKLARMERRNWRRPNPRDIKDLLDLYGVTDEAQRDYLITLAREGRQRGWWHSYVDMLSEQYTTYIDFEAGAKALYAFQPISLPGLLQTKDYALALVKEGPAEISDAEAERRVDLRMERQRILTGEDPLRLWVVLDEAVLRRQVGGPDVMRGQLAHLLEVTKLALVTLQVISFEAGAHSGTTGPFTILEFPDPRDPQAVYVDTPAGELFVEHLEEVRRFQTAFERLRATALSPRDSIAMIAATAA